MANRFDYFVVFAEMRTGSNFLETNINAFPGLKCFGEAFNPNFVGYPNRDDILGVDLEARTNDPLPLIDAIKGQPILGGFRVFHDHDPRAFKKALDDPYCAKIILTRNPIDSYVSLKIAQATGQWKLTDVRRRKDARKVAFDRAEFKAHLEELQDFQLGLMHGLQTTGQSAFYIAYEDLNDLGVINGLARFLGQEDQLEKLDTSLKRQNPSPVSEKVSNFDEISRALSDLDRFNLTRTPNFEPRRGAAVPSYAAAARSPLLFLPVKGTPEQEILDWLAALDGVRPDTLSQNFNQKALRQWRRAQRGHRSFTVIDHPAARAHRVFCSRILNPDKGSFKQIRNALRRVYKLPIPKNAPDGDYGVDAHRAAFFAFLDFVKANLAGQTSLRIDASWATQSSQLKGFAEVATPDMVIRTADLESYLPALAVQVGRMDAPDVPEIVKDQPYALAQIYNAEVEARVADVYQRDYMNFGFGPWSEENVAVQTGDTD